MVIVWKAVSVTVEDVPQAELPSSGESSLDTNVEVGVPEAAKMPVLLPVAEGPALTLEYLVLVFLPLPCGTAKAEEASSERSPNLIMLAISGAISGMLHGMVYGNILDDV